MQPKFNKQQWTLAFNKVLLQPVGKILEHSNNNRAMMQHIYPADVFLETLAWIEEHFNYERKDDVTKGIVFTLGIATLSQLYVNHLNEETA